MASKRDLKRTINYITSELFAETSSVFVQWETFSGGRRWHPFIYRNGQ